MTKRKLDDNLRTPRKKAKLACLGAAPNHYTRNINPVPTALLLPVALGLQNKRKRLDESEAEIFRELKARRIESRSHNTSNRFGHPRSLSPGSKWMRFSYISDEDEEPALNRHWERMIARPPTPPQLNPLSSLTPPDSPAGAIKEDKTVYVAIKTALALRPARLHKRPPSFANNSSRKKQTSQQVKKCNTKRQPRNQHKPHGRKPATHIQDSFLKQCSRPVSRCKLWDLVNDDLACPEAIIR